MQSNTIVSPLRHLFLDVYKRQGQGGPGVNGGPAGDLYITFSIAEDSRFKRVGDDLYITAPLNLYTAILGGEQIVETMDGKVKLKVAAGTQNNSKVRLKGKGFPVYKKDGQFGDLIVTYSIEIPTNLTDKQKELFREIQSLNPVSYTHLDVYKRQPPEQLPVHRISSAAHSTTLAAFLVVDATNV